MKMNTLKKTIGGVTLGAALLFVPVKKATAAELTTNLGTNPNHPARVMPESATLETEAVSVLDSEASLEGGDPNPCPLLTKLNISGMTSEEVAAINKVWEMQPEWFRPYIEKFFMDNIGKFKGMEKEWVICLMNELY